MILCLGGVVLSSCLSLYVVHPYLVYNPLSRVYHPSLVYIPAPPFVLVNFIGYTSPRQRIRCQIPCLGMSETNARGSAGAPVVPGSCTARAACAAWARRLRRLRCDRAPIEQTSVCVRVCAMGCRRFGLESGIGLVGEPMPKADGRVRGETRIPGSERLGRWVGTEGGRTSVR